MTESKTTGEPLFERSERDLRALRKHKTFVVTCAQNNVAPEADFLAALQRYCTAHDAALLVIPIRYQNPTSKLDPQDEGGDVSWDQELEPYLIENELVLSDHVVIQADMRIQATARNPLASLQSRSKWRSAIFGSSQLAMQTVATPQNKLPKILYTTGSVTQKAYSKSKAGQLARFHHTHSAIVVELRGKRFHLREITWDGLTFIDLGEAWSADGQSCGGATEALVLGDSHTWWQCPKTLKATFGRGGIVDTLKPDYLIRHDLVDAYSVSHHHLKNQITRIVKTLSGRSDLRAELQHAVDHLNETTPPGTKNIIVSSNHNDHVTQWLRGGERGVEAVNAEFYHWLMWRVLQEARMTSRGVVHPDPLALYAEDKLTCDTQFLGSDDSFTLAGVELAMHGHLGPNGSRGSLRSLSVIGSRFMVGHSHAPGIYEGGYQVGTSSVLRMEYNGGPSSWLNTHGALYENGKRQMIHVIDGHWRG